MTTSRTPQVLEGAVLEKPGSNERAKEMLQRSAGVTMTTLLSCMFPISSPCRLSGHTHLVYTGMALLYREEGGGALQEHCFYEKTEVTFAPLSADVLQAYVDSGEPL